MKLTWFGTASVALTGSGGSLLFDPFLPLNGAEAALPVETYDGFHHVFVTHGHFDHIVDLPLIAARNPDLRIWCTQTPGQTLVKKGVPAKSICLFHFGDEMEVDGFRIHAYHGKHAVLPRATAARLGRCLASPYRSNLPHILWQNLCCPQRDETVFYEITGEGKRIALMGSLNLRDEVVYPTEADQLVLPYNGWDDNLPQATRVIDRLKPKHVVLDHWDVSFPPLTQPIDLQPLMDRYGDRITVLRPMESMQL